MRWNRIVNFPPEPSIFSIVRTKVLVRKSFLNGVAPDVTHMSRNTLTELESNLMLSVDRNPDEFKHVRRRPNFFVWIIADMNIWVLLVSLRRKL